MSDIEYEETYYNNNYFNQIEAEEHFDNICEYLEDDLDEMREIAGMYGDEDLLEDCSAMDLLDFLKNGDRIKVKKVIDKNDIFIPYPEEFDEEITCEWDIKFDGPEWVVLKTEQQLREDQEKQRQWEEENRERLEMERLEKEKQMKEEALRLKAQQNKYNWTLPAELRGIDTTPKKKKVSKSKRRKERRKGGFRVNRGNPEKM